MTPIIRKIAALAALIVPHFALAATNISIGIPGQTAISSSSPPGVFITNFYQFSIFVGGLLAFAVVVYGGVKYMVSAGNPSGQSDAKEWIWGALLGLLLLGCAYLILFTINPQLVQLGLIQTSAVGIVTPPPVTLGPTPTSTVGCPIPALSPITDPLAQQMEAGQTVLWSSSDPAVQQNLTALQAAYQKFNTAIATVRDSGTVNSVYRPLAYQAHFYQIYQDATKYQIFAAQPTANNYSSNLACSSIISALESEENKHGVCRTPSQCLVAQPTNCDPHVAGIGIDITLSGPVGYSGINAILQKYNVGLVFRGLPNDPVHFQLTNPPSGSCPS